MSDKLITLDGMNASFEEYHRLQSSKRYGVQFPSGGSNSGTRLWDAIDMTSTPTFGSTAGSSDFDDAEPFKHRRCNVKNGEVVSYKGYPDFDENGGNGDVYEEFNNVYLYISEDENTFGVSMRQWDDDWFPAVLVNGEMPSKIYIPAYKMTKDSSGKGRSIAGGQPYWDSFSGHLNAAKLNGDMYHTGPSWYDTWKQVMLAVEYASRDAQNGSQMQGFSGGLYSQTGCQVSNDAVSTNIIPVNNPQNLVVGQTVRICTGWISQDKTDDRHITNIDSSGKTITIDGDPVTVENGWTVYNMDWKTGSTLSVTGDTGQAVKSNKYPMKWRGIEDIWGGSAEDICDLRIMPTGGATDPWEFYYCPDPRIVGTSDNPNDNYFNTGITMPSAEGYAKSFQAPDGYPNVRLIHESGASSTTYYADYFWRSTTATTARSVRSGGNWRNGAVLGVSYRLCNHAALSSDRNYCARLFFTR